MSIPDGLPAVSVDPVLASQVVDNLLENVAVIRRPRSACASAATRRRVVRLRVEDGGQGVPPMRCRTSSRSSTACRTRREAGRQGTGLGLALVKGMAEAMGGSVSASRCELGGLAVDVRLPVAVAPPPDDGAIVTERRASILLVEDDEERDERLPPTWRHMAMASEPRRTARRRWCSGSCAGRI